MKKFGWLGVVVLVVMVLTLGCGRSGALNPEEFYKNKTIDWTVPSSGGSIDLAARVMQPVLAKHLGSTVVVTNLTGGGGLEGTNHVYMAEPDGTHIGIQGSNVLVFTAIFDPAGAKYEPDKYSYILRFPLDPVMFFVAKDSTYSSVEVLKAGKKMVLGTLFPSGNWAVSTVTLAHLLDLDAKVLAGLTAGELGLRIAQGELQGGIFAASHGPKQPRLKPLFVLGTKRAKLYPDIPALSELVKFTDPAKQHLLELGDTLLPTNRGIFATPNVPKDRLDFLKTAFIEKVIPETRAELTKALETEVSSATIVSGDEVAKEVISQWKEKDRLKQTFGGLIEKYRL